MLGRQHINLYFVHVSNAGNLIYSHAMRLWQQVPGLWAPVSGHLLCEPDQQRVLQVHLY